MSNNIRRAFVAALVLAAAPLTIASPASATGIGHTMFMRGSIVSMSGDVATICVGKADGATPGQVLNVVQVKMVPGGAKGAPTPQRTNVGTVHIDAIIDDHFATATVVSGKAATNDIVELKK